jgi:predicted small lipoprotein YifL
MGMKTLRDRPARLALIAAMITAFGVSGCGRKGPLDPPPAALSNSQPAPGTEAPTTERPGLGDESGFVPQLAQPLGRPQQQASAPPPQPPKNFFLDFLINK